MTKALYEDLNNYSLGTARMFMRWRCKTQSKKDLRNDSHPSDSIQVELKNIIKEAM